jgi:hypothetical protein
MQSRVKDRRRNAPRFKPRSLKTLEGVHPRPCLSQRMSASRRRRKGKCCCLRPRAPLMVHAGGLSTAKRWVKARPRPSMVMVLSPLQSSACLGGVQWTAPLQVRIDSVQVILLFQFERSLGCGCDGIDLRFKSSQTQRVDSDQIRFCLIAGDIRVQRVENRFKSSHFFSCADTCVVKFSAPAGQGCFSDLLPIKPAS